MGWWLYVVYSLPRWARGTSKESHTEWLSVRVTQRGGSTKKKETPSFFHVERAD